MLRRFKRYFFSGLVIFLPLILTFYVFAWFLNFSESIFGKYLRPFLLNNYDFYIWGLGIIVLVIFILFCGFLVTNYFGRAIHRATENLMMRIPIMASVYPAFKEIAKFIFKEEDGSGGLPQQVVLVQWPKEGLWTIGFLTNKTPQVICVAAGRKLVNVLVPTVPNPLTGFIAMVPEEQVIRLPISVEEAIKIIVSGGVVDPHAIVSPEKTV